MGGDSDSDGKEEGDLIWGVERKVVYAVGGIAAIVGALLVYRLWANRRAATPRYPMGFAPPPLPLPPGYPGGGPPGPLPGMPPGPGYYY